MNVLGRTHWPRTKIQLEKTLFFLSPSFAYLQKQVVMEKLRTAQKQWQLQQVGPSA